VTFGEPMTTVEYSKKYYLDNKDSIIQKVKVYAPIRKEHLLSLGLCITCGKSPISFDRSKSKCSSCLDKGNKYGYKKNSSKYYQENKKKILASQKKRYEENPEKAKDYKKSLYQKHKPQFLHDRKIARYKRRSAKGSHTLQEWLGILISFGGRCLWCETKENIERDHVIPISQGGTNYIHNIQPLCKTCNRRKWNKILDFRPFGRAILDWT
jgi:5-methylcytosine-specific restriction endonuclease McrA